MKMVEFTVGVVGVIPDTEEARRKVRDIVERAMLREGVALKFCVSRFDPIDTTARVSGDG